MTNLKKLISLIFLIFLSVYSFGQVNLVANPGFDGASVPSSCYTNTNPLGTPYSTFTVPDWQLATTDFHYRRKKISNYGIYKLSLNSCDPKYNNSGQQGSVLDCPLSTTQTFSSDKSILYLNYFKSGNKSYHDAIGTTLNSPLTAGNSYVLEFKIAPLKAKDNQYDVYSGTNNMFFYFTDHGVNDWSNATATESINFYNVVDQNCKIYGNELDGWKRYQFFFSLPAQNPFGGTFPDLKYLILYVEDGAFYITDVKVYEACPTNLLIQNTTYTNAFTHQYLVQASNKITAVNNVTNYPNTNIIYKAGSAIDLLPGFTANDNFTVEIAPCTAQQGFYREVASDGHPIFTTNVTYKDSTNSQDRLNNITIYPNPSTQTFNVYSSSGFAQQPQVFNLLGQSINARFKQMGKTGYQIDMSGHPKGIYLIRIGATVKRLVLE